MVALAHIAAVDDDEILNAQNVGRQDITLQGHPVAVPAVDVDDGLHALLLHDDAAGQGAHPHDAVVHVGDDNGIHPSLHATGISDEPCYIDALGRVHLRQYDKFICL